MRKLTKILLAGALLLSLGGSAAAAAAAVTVDRALDELRCRSISDDLKLRTRVDQLESVLTDKFPGLMDRALEVLAPADGGPDGAPAGDVPADASAIAGEQPDDMPAGGVDEVTSPALHAADAPAETYVIRAYNGIIGVFDGSGLPVRTVNTAVDTLPAADRAALEEGIPAASFEEMCRIADMYA